MKKLPPNGGTNAKRHRMICRDCFNKYRRLRKKGIAHFYGRFTLPRPYNSYAREPKCPNCGGTNLRDVEQQRRREARKRPRCNCAGYPFPHEPGAVVFSNIFCVSHPERLADIPLTDEESRDYEALWATPRTR